MNEEKLELVRGSGNVFADFGYPQSDIEQLKSLLAAKIIGLLEERQLSVRKAEAITKIAAADFSRLRKAKLKHFTIDRLMTILNRFDQAVDVSIVVQPRKLESGQSLSVN
jgi:predicted XRE-type DNA-binding protein